MRQIATADAILDYDIHLVEDAAGTGPGMPNADDSPRKAGRRAAPARVVITRRASAAIEGGTTYKTVTSG